MLKTIHLPTGSRQVRLNGWKKQPVDARDEAYSIKLQRKMLGVNPATTDLRNFCSPIQDQGNLGSCTAHMFAALVEANENRGLKKLKYAAVPGSPPQVGVSNVLVSKTGVITYTTTVTPATVPTASATKPQISVSNISLTTNGVASFSTMVVPPAAPAPTPVPGKLIRASRLFEYYATRRIEGTVSIDSGAYIRDAIKAGYTYGVVDELLWPYIIAKFTTNPTSSVWTTAATHKVTSYHAIANGDIETMKAALVSGFLVGFGFLVFDAFLSSQVANTGLVVRPGPSERIQGGHAVCLVGYDDNKVMPDGSKGAFLVRNSWGTGWGYQGSGYYWMSYNYVSDTSLCSDFWVVQSSPL